jgi:hypothetical protein
MDEEQKLPEARFHPTIFMVKLDRQATQMWEASETYRNRMLVEWRAKAKLSGKAKIEIWGKYCKLGEFETEVAA